MPDFVILLHETATGTHFDLMLQAGEVLKTWSIDNFPQSGGVATARLIADHRLAYLQYEGPIAGNRGRVTRWDTGTYQVIDQSQTAWRIAITGKKLCGKLTLLSEDKVSKRWQLIYEPTAKETSE